jgi:hypothetical protein
VNFLVPGHEDYIDGKAALLCSYCDEDDQNIITQTAFARLKLQVRKDPTGMIPLTFAWKGVGKSTVKKFSVRNDDEIETDVRFGMKRSEESTKTPVALGDEDDESAESVSEGMHQLGKSPC